MLLLRIQVLHGAGYITHVVPPVRSWREERRMLEESMESIRKGACDAEIRDKYGEFVVLLLWAPLARRCIRSRLKPFRWRWLL